MNNSPPLDTKSQLLLDAARDGKAAHVRQLLFTGMGVDPRRPGGKTPLLDAAHEGHKEVVELLLNARADKEATDNPYNDSRQGGTPLTYAAFNGHAAVVQLLLKAKANTDAQNHLGWTPLIAASFKGHASIAKMLIEAGAKKGTKDVQGLPALYYAKSSLVREAGHVDIIKMLEASWPEHNAIGTPGLSSLSLKELADELGLTTLECESGVGANP